MQFRQGDVLIRSITSIPNAADKQKPGRIILALGEVTGHAHTIEETEKVESFIDKDGKLFLRVQAPTRVAHQEHTAIDLPIGTYEVIHQREYTPEEIRRVQD